MLSAFLPVEDLPMVCDASFLSPPNQKASQCQVLCRAHSAPVPEVADKAQTGFSPFYHPKKKEKPPPPVPPPAPPPPPPAKAPPIVIVCCCTCYDVCVRRDEEGPYINLDLLADLCSQAPCTSKAGFLPFKEYLSLASCSKCHHLPHLCPRLFPLLPPPARVSPKAPLSLLPTQQTSQTPQRQD